MGDAKGLCQLVQRNDSRIPPAPLKAAQILLAKPGSFGELLLGQAFLLPDLFDVPADQLAHIHALRSAEYIL